jgi:hypothetical protein
LVRFVCEEERCNDTIEIQILRLNIVGSDQSAQVFREVELLGLNFMEVGRARAVAAEGRKFAS